MLVLVLVKDLVIVMVLVSVVVLAPLSTNAGCSILPASKRALSADIHTFCRKTNVVVTIQSDITRFCIIALICFKIQLCKIRLKCIFCCPAYFYLCWHLQNVPDFNCRLWWNFTRCCKKWKWNYNMPQSLALQRPESIIYMLPIRRIALVVADQSFLFLRKLVGRNHVDSSTWYR